MTRLISPFVRELRGRTASALGRHGLAAAALFLCMPCGWAIAGTAGVANGEFDVDLTGWTLAGPPFAAWSMLDYQGSPSSGSASLSNDAPQPGVRLYPLRQCVHLPAAGRYRIEAQGFLPVGHPAGRLVVSLASHAIADCSGGSNLGVGYFLSSNGNWQYGSIEFNIESGFNYVDLSLGIEKNAAGGSLVGNIDAVRLIYREVIFASGFEAVDLPISDP